MSSATDTTKADGQLFDNLRTAIQHILVYQPSNIVGNGVVIHDGDSAADPVIFDVTVEAEMSFEMHFPAGLKVSDGFFADVDAGIELTMVQGNKYGGSYQRRTSTGTFFTGRASVQGILVTSSTNGNIVIHDSTTNDNEKITMKVLANRSVYIPFYDHWQVHAGIHGVFTNVDSCTVFLA